MEYLIGAASLGALLVAFRFIRAALKARQERNRAIWETKETVELLCRKLGTDPRGYWDGVQRDGLLDIQNRLSRLEKDVNNLQTPKKEAK